MYGHPLHWSMQSLLTCTDVDLLKIPKSWLTACAATQLMYTKNSGRSWQDNCCKTVQLHLFGRVASEVRDAYHAARCR